MGVGEDMHRCLILPIIDGIGSNLPTDVHNDLEDYLKNSNWCYYQSNSQIMDLVSPYKGDMLAHLNNAALLSSIAKKMRAGALLRIKLDHAPNGIEIDFAIIGANGEDIYFSQKGIVDASVASLVTAKIVSFLEIYASTIPYDAQIVGVVGNQIQLDSGKAFNISVGDALFVLRPLKKKKHPLLNEVVEWERVEIAKGEIFNTTQDQSMGIIKQTTKGFTISKGDWVKIFQQEKPKILFGEESLEEYKKKDFSRLGEIQLNLIGAMGESSTFMAGQRRIIGGMQLGINSKLNLWATRNYFAGVELEKGLSSYKKIQGPLNQESLTLTKNVFKFKAGYKYLPLGYFYGPQVEGYTGYAKINYGLDTSVEDGFADVNFNGVLLGVNGSAPLYEKFRINVCLEFLAFPHYFEEQVVLGDAQSVSSYQVTLGGLYEWNERTNLLATIILESHKALFNGSTTQLNHKANVFSLGIGYIF